MTVLIFIGITVAAVVIAIMITHFITKNKYGIKVHELEVQNEALQLRHMQIGQQLSELMKLKEQADERLFNLDKYLALAIREKELTYEQISKLEQRMQEEKELKEQLQLKLLQIENYK